MIRFQHPLVAFVIHHTQTRISAEVEAIRTDHKAKGWGDIGYHWLIRMGKAVPGRPEVYAGSHAPGWNGRALGVALIGDYRDFDPPDPQLSALCKLLTELSSTYGRLRILSHREAMVELFREVGLARWCKITHPKIPFEKLTKAQKDPEKYTDCPGRPWVDLVRTRLGWGGPVGTLPDSAYKDPA